MLLPELDVEAAIAELEDNAGEIRPSRADELRARLERGERVDARTFFDVLDAKESERRFFELAPSGAIAAPDEVTLRYVVARFGDSVLPFVERWAIGGEAIALLASWGSELAADEIRRRLVDGPKPLGHDKRGNAVVRTAMTDPSDGAAIDTDSIQLEDIVPASPEAIYDAWISAVGHAAMTGAEATGASEVGSAFTAWGGYISGSHLELSRPEHIVQSWRTSEFPADAEHSRVAITLAAIDGGTNVSIAHSNIPKGQGVKYQQGWVTHYFEPMKKHFG